MMRTISEVMAETALGETPEPTGEVIEHPKKDAAPKPVYAPIPMRACVDSRLSARHYRTLAVIAAHDRLGANGAGCWASHKRLAEMIGCNYSRLSENIRQLAEWGYLLKDKHPVNPRMRVYRVVYTADDAAVMKGNGLPDGKAPRADDSLPKGDDDAGIVCQKISETPGFRGTQRVNIFRETGNTSRRNDGIDTPEGARASRTPRNRHDEEFVGERLRVLEKGMAEGAFVKDSEKVLDWLLEVEEGYAGTDLDRLSYWAQRLYTDLETYEQRR
ncbi:MAG: hypothetical protein ACMVY4_12325 [Minwuia sp.]|uniref:hypothetical protein n=1 Tax=Minwuia sp. TaxID=2493630 RepID=UPI003A85BD3F